MITTATAADEILVRFDGLLFFANAHRLKEAVRARVSEQPAATRVVVDASGVTGADATVAEMLAELGDDLADQGVALEITEPRPSDFAEIGGRDDERQEARR